MAKRLKAEIRVVELANFSLPRGVKEADFYIEVYCGSTMRRIRAPKRKSPVFETALKFDVTTQSRLDVFVYYKAGQKEDLLGVLDYQIQTLLDTSDNGEVLQPLYNVLDKVGDLKWAVSISPADEDLSLS